MTVATAVAAVIDKHHPHPLPNGAQAWYALGRATGDVSGGLMEFRIGFNEGSDRKFLGWVQVHHIGFAASTANPGNGLLRALSGQYERNVAAGTSLPMTTVEQTGPGTTVWGGARDGLWNFGRLEKGTQGRLQLEFENVSTSVVDIYVSGLLWDRPQLGTTGAIA